MSKATLYRFYNEAVSGSLKNIGAGWRTVVCLPPGRKWVTLVDWTTLDVATIPLLEWQRLKPALVVYRTGRVLKAIKHMLPYKFDDGKPTQAIKAAMQIIRGGGQ